MTPSDQSRRSGRFAVVAGFLGIIGTGLLIAALFAPTPAPGTMRRETVLFLWQDAFVILQGLAMIPVTLRLYRLRSDRDGAGGRTLALGLIAQVGVVITTALIFTDTVSDMLYMGPIGLVGLWVFLVNRPRVALTSPKVAWTGRVAALGLLLVGVGFLIYGALVAPTVFVRPLTTAEIDAQTLTLANLISHLCLAVGTLLGRVLYPIWIMLLGRTWLRVSEGQMDEPALAAA
jgi:hypothetical protein